MKKILLILITTLISAPTFTQDLDVLLESRLRDKKLNLENMKEFKSDKKDFSTNGVTLLMISAALADKINIPGNTKTTAELLIEDKNIANVAYKKYLDEKFYDEYKTYTAPVRQYSKQGFTALMYAVMGGTQNHSQIIETIIEEVKNVNGKPTFQEYLDKKTNHGNKLSAIMYSVSFTKPKSSNEIESRKKIFHTLINAGADINIDDTDPKFNNNDVKPNLILNTISKNDLDFLMEDVMLNYFYLKKNDPNAWKKRYKNEDDFIKKLDMAEMVAPKGGAIHTTINSFQQKIQQNIAENVSTNSFSYDFKVRTYYNYETLNSLGDKSSSKMPISFPFTIKYNISQAGTIIGDSIEISDFTCMSKNCYYDDLIKDIYVKYPDAYTTTKKKLKNEMNKKEDTKWTDKYNPEKGQAYIFINWNYKIEDKDIAKNDRFILEPQSREGKAAILLNTKPKIFNINSKPIIYDDNSDENCEDYNQICLL